MTLLRKIYTAVAEAREKRAELIEFTETFSQSTIDKWTAMLCAWQKDPYQAINPFDEPAPSAHSILYNRLFKHIEIFEATTVNEVRKELNAEEDLLLKSGALPLHETSATQFLILGIGLEDSQ